MSTIVGEVIAEARSQTGLTDLGPESFHEGLVALLEGAEQAGSFNEIGMTVLRNQAAYWERSPRRTLAYRDTGHEDRLFDIGFAEMRPDPIPAIERLYQWLDVEFTDDVASRMAAWWNANPADKHGANETHAEDYGIDLDELRGQFAFYNDRFAGAVSPGHAA